MLQSLIEESIAKVIAGVNNTKEFSGVVCVKGNFDYQ